jgi:hypothetical protein
VCRYSFLRTVVLVNTVLLVDVFCGLWKFRKRYKPLDPAEDLNKNPNGVQPVVWLLY